MNDKLRAALDALNAVAVDTGELVLGEEQQAEAQKLWRAHTYILAKVELVAQPGGKKTPVFSLGSMRMYELGSALPSVPQAGIRQIILSSPLKRWLGADTKRYAQFLSWLDSVMSQSENPHFVNARKGRILYSDKPRSEIEVCRTFETFSDVKRAEHEGQILTARGIPLSGHIPMPKEITDPVADGCVWQLSKSEGAALGLEPGVYQHRSEKPFSKGTIHVAPTDDFMSFTNRESLKLKEPLPPTMEGGNIRLIADSARYYRMRVSHQMGYELRNTGADAWGDIPQVIRKNVEEMDITSMLPAEHRFLLSRGLPKEFLIAPQDRAKGLNFSEGEVKRDIEPLVVSMLRAARPVAAFMFMFMALDIKYVDRELFPKAGWYKPAEVEPDNQMTNVIGRVPFLAFGGGMQDVEMAGGWAGVSPLPNVIYAIVDPNEVAVEGSVSNIIQRQIASMGADVDGDRLFVVVESGLELLKGAGLSFTLDAPQLKCKNGYKGIEGWSKRDLMNLWCISTPRLMQVGTGDTIARHAVDAFKGGKLDLETYKGICEFSAGQVQVGVSAPKYDFKNPYRSPMPLGEVKKLAESVGGLGMEFAGALYNPAREVAERKITEFYSDVEHVKEVKVGIPGKRWEGGYSAFHTSLNNYDASSGIDWASYVRMTFRAQLQKLGIKKEEYGKHKLTIRKLVAQYIKDFPQNQYIWAWMLSDEFIQPESEGATLKVMGMPRVQG